MLRKLFEVAPLAFNLFLGKYKGDTDAFYYDVVNGVCCVSQEEGGSPGAPEMGFAYELGVSDLITEIVHELELDLGEERGFFASFMDDFYWGAPFHKMIEVIDFVQKRGPDFGYHLNLGKSFYLMQPTDGKPLTEAQLEDRIHQLVTRGFKIENIRIHPDCFQSGNRSGILFGFKVLGTYVGHSDYVEEENMEGLIHKPEVLLQHDK